jgi:hypothetical protein
MPRPIHLALLAPLAAFPFACAPATDLGDLEDADERAFELSLAFEELDVRKSAAQAGLTVITKTADYVAFFGEAPPAGVDFKKHWVLHYSMGVQSTGGYDANILEIEREGSGAGSSLVITTQDVSPGPMCLVTQALTNPQVTVKIKKQKKTIEIQQITESTVTDCSQPNWCAAALCAPGTTCDELVDACVGGDFCPVAKCANGYVCDEDQDACVGRPCDPNDALSCPSGMACENHIVCITWPCPADFRCAPASDDPCQGIDWAGTCEGSTLKYCDAGQLVTIDCSPYDCGWNAGQSYFDCL